MSSVNEEMPTPPKHRLSPFELRNTDLVSRLLAATPPYLYNMPLVPHSYFFSEMLRSLVQSKTEAAARLSNNVPHRRSRKRTWAQGRAEHFSQKQELEKNPKTDSQEMPPPIWTPTRLTNERKTYENKIERPLELTMNKIHLNNNNLSSKQEIPRSEASTSRTNDYKHNTTSTKPEIDHNNHIPMMFPPIPNMNSPDQSSSTDLILPPPPPIWYPPVYPPYGIDPLHFFIDLRVSGHIYDRKNQNDKDNFNIPQPNPELNLVNQHSQENSHNTLQLPNSESPNIISSFSLNRESRHTSAFSVPTPSLNINNPLNLTCESDRKGKFDIKSMGFDSSENKQSANYVLKNLVKIYADVSEAKYKNEGMDLTSSKQTDNVETEVEIKQEEKKDGDEKDEDKEKKCKDLRALIGLELVVDYVNHNVKPKQSISEESSTDVDSRCSSASTVEIVSVPDV